MNLSEIKSILRSEGIQLTRSLGQNFMHDTNQIRKMVQWAQIKPGDSVLEIGPGLGPLTEVLLESGANILAIEKDARLVTFLQNRFQSQIGSRLELLHADALDWLKTRQTQLAQYKLISNLPYSVGSPILVECALTAWGPPLIVVTLQREVAEKIRSQAGNKSFGLLTHLVGIRYRTRNLFRISAACFFPPPDVDSACIVLEKKEYPIIVDSHVSHYVQLCRLAFSQRRKMLIKLLKTNWPETQLLQSFDDLNIPLKARAEDLSPDIMAKLTLNLNAPKTL